MIQLSHLYMTTGKTIALTIWTFVSKVIIDILLSYKDVTSRTLWGLPRQALPHTLYFSSCLKYLDHSSWCTFPELLWRCKTPTKGNLLTIWCIFTGRTNVESEAPTLWPPDAKSWFTGKDPDAGKDWGQKEIVVPENDMVGCHHRLHGHELQQTPGDSEGWGSFVCYSPWGHRVRHNLGTGQQLLDIHEYTSPDLPPGA